MRIDGGAAATVLLADTVKACESIQVALEAGAVGGAEAGALFLDLAPVAAHVAAEVGASLRKPLLEGILAHVEQRRASLRKVQNPVAAPAGPALGQQRGPGRRGIDSLPADQIGAQGRLIHPLGDRHRDILLAARLRQHSEARRPATAEEPQLGGSAPGDGVKGRQADQLAVILDRDDSQSGTLRGRVAPPSQCPGGGTERGPGGNREVVPAPEQRAELRSVLEYRGNQRFRSVLAVVVASIGHLAFVTPSRRRPGGSRRFAHRARIVRSGTGLETCEWTLRNLATHRFVALSLDRIRVSD